MEMEWIKVSTPSCEILNSVVEY